MRTNTNRVGHWTAIAVAIGLFCFSEANAKKPEKPSEGRRESRVHHCRPARPLSRHRRLEPDFHRSHFRS